MSGAGTWLIWVKLAARNLLKNRRRSGFTLAAVALGFAAVNLFGGFTAYIFNGMEEGYVYAFSNGHLSIFKKGFSTEGRMKPLQYMLTEEELARAAQVCRQDDRVLLTTPQMFLSGLISNGDSSAVFLAMGRVPSDVKRIRACARSTVGRLSVVEGQPLEDEAPYSIAVCRGLAEKLALQLGAGAVVVAPTLDGQMNALDAEMVSTFSAPHETLADKLILVPLSFARELVDTTSADRLTVLLRHTSDTEPARRDLTRKLREAGLDVEVRTWSELAVSYRRIRQMFIVLFAFLFSIVFVIVVLSVVNTIGMAVLERTREIGTLRALGMRRRGTAFMFATESALLGMAGSFAGLVLTVAVWGVVRLVKPYWVPPVFATKVPFEVYLVPAYLAVSVVCLTVLAIAAGVAPARRAARRNIVDALGHV